jgi:hypothetical protein
MKKSIVVILVALFLIHLGFVIVGYWPRYTAKLDGVYWEGKYQKSQWVIPNSKNSIGDDGLYAYHGWILLHGGDPSLVNPEVPPLGKYLIGVTELLFNNNNIFGLFTSLLLLTVFYLMNMQLFRNKLVAFLPIFLFSFEPLFTQQFMGSYLDSLHVSFLLLTFLFFYRKQFVLSSIFLGCFAMTKFSYLAGFAAFSMVLYTFLVMRKELYSYLISLFMVPIVGMLSYLRFFLLGHTPFDYLRLQKYIVSFYSTGAKATVFGMVFPMIFLNKWYTWWDGVQSMAEWTIGWPLTFVGAVYSLRFIRRNLASPFFHQLLWCCCYLVFLLLTPVFSRYLLLLLPFLYNLSIWALLRSINVKSLSQSHL